MKTITKYETEDGKLFDKEQEAKEHETELNRPKEQAKSVTFNFKILKEYSNGATFEEALALSEKEGKPLLTNLQADEILQNEELHKANSKLFPCWTGIITVYENAGTPFGEYVKDQQSGWVFDVPKKYQGKKDIVLVLQQKDYKLKKEKYGIIHLTATKVESLSFPTENGWYLPDPKFGIPTGDKVNEDNPNVQFLWRVTDGDPIRPLARDGDWDWDHWRAVLANWVPANRLGVGLAEPQAKQGKKKINTR